MSTVDRSKTDVPAAEKVGDAVGMEQRRWLVARVSNNTEKKSRDTLIRLGYNAVAATQKEIHDWKGRRVEVEVVRIATYLFVYVNTEERTAIINFPFIKSYLQDRTTTTTQNGHHQDVVITEAEMTRMRAMLDQCELPVEFEPGAFKTNDYVRVRRGPMQGIVGRLYRVDREGRKKFGVNIQGFGCATVYIPYNELELVTEKEYDDYNELVSKTVSLSKNGR